MTAVNFTMSVYTSTSTSTTPQGTQYELLFNSPVGSDYTELPASALFNTSDYEDSSLSTSENITVPEGCVVLQFSDFVPWDNPDTLISLEVEETFDMVVSVVFLNLLYFIRYLCSSFNHRALNKASKPWCVIDAMKSDRLFQ